MDGLIYYRHRRHQEAAGASRSAEFFPANAGQIFASWKSERLWIEREELLGLADAAQGEAADRYQARPLGGHVGWVVPVEYKTRTKDSSTVTVTSYYFWFSEEVIRGVTRRMEVCP